MTDRIILLASSKGGVGKSTLALGIARALMKRSKTVLLADLDFANPCLDLLSGMENQIIFTVADAAAGRCRPTEALLQPDPRGKLYLLPAPAAGEFQCLSALPSPHGEDGPSGDTADAASIADVLRQGAQATEADYVLLDTGAGLSAGLEVAVTVATGAIVAAGHNPVSIRAAQQTGTRLQALGISDVRLAVNAFDSGKNGRMPLLDIIDGAGIGLLGAVPYDGGLLLSQEGVGKIGPAAQAFDNIAARLDGQNVPLFDGIPKLRKKRRRLFR